MRDDETPRYKKKKVKGRFSFQSRLDATEHWRLYNGHWYATERARDNALRDAKRGNTIWIHFYGHPLEFRKVSR